MKKIIKISTLFLFFFTLFFVTTKPVLAAANFWLSPSSKSISQGQNISITIGVDTNGESVNAVQANLSYPVDKFDYVSLSTSGSALSIIAEKSVSGGQVRIAGGAMPPGFSGSKSIATITLKAKVNSGSASISFNSDSSVLRNSDNQNIASGKPSGNYTFQGQVQASPKEVKSSPFPNNTSIATSTPLIKPSVSNINPTTQPVEKSQSILSNPIFLYVFLGISLLGLLVCFLYIFSKSKRSY